MVHATPVSGQKAQQTAFVSNLLRNGTVTEEMAHVLSTLATPHQQLEAMLRRKREPHKSLTAIVNEMQSPAKALRKPVQPVLRMPRLSIPWARLGGGIARFAGALTVLGCLGLTIRTSYEYGWTPWRRHVPSSSLSAPAVAAERLMPDAARFSELVVTQEPPPAPRPAAPERPTPPAIKPIPRKPKTVAPALPLEAAPARFTATLMPTGFYAVSWEGVPGAQYRFYYGASPDAITTPDAHNPIPFNSMAWIPPAGKEDIWLTVCRIGPDGRESARSTPIHLVLPKLSD